MKRLVNISLSRDGPCDILYHPAGFGHGVEQSEAVVRQIESLGGQGLFIRTDVSRRADIEALVAGTIARFGRLDYAVNNAGISRTGSHTDCGYRTGCLE